jgi:hypothetical protein
MGIDHGRWHDSNLSNRHKATVSSRTAWATGYNVVGNVVVNGRFFGGGSSDIWMLLENFSKRGGWQCSVDRTRDG